jgi:hypothetical protein
MNKKFCYSEGYNTGYNIAKENEGELLTSGQFDDAMLEQFASDMSEFESDSFRQFTPFEFFAHDINNSHDPDGLWDSYDEGVWAGIQRRIREFKHEYAEMYIHESVEA